MSNPFTEESPVAAPAEGAGGADETIAPLESSDDPRMVQLQGDAERFKDLALRTQADFENFRRRAAREKEDAIKFANASFLDRLIPVLDNFELGLNAARGKADSSAILLGMDMVAKQLQDFLGSSGVEPVLAEGQKFDPNLHEAVAQEESAEVPEGVILRQLRKGFKLRDRLLRPATVVVSKGAAPSQP